MRKSRTLYQILLLFILIAHSLFSQTSIQIRGTVKDSFGQTLPGAHIFIANSTYGTTSNSDGTYTLKVPNPGNYQLVASFSGFNNQSMTIELSGDLIYDFILVEQVRDLGGFEVLAKKDREWKERLAQFKQMFLGTSSNARKSKILNQTSIDFYFNQKENVLEAFSSEPIQIRNQALGYDIEFYLDEFKIFYSTGYSSTIGFPLFKSFPKNELKDRTLKNRVKAYRGSKQHFFSSLYNNQLIENGFLLRPAKADTLDRILISQDTITSVRTFENPDDRPMQWRFDDYYVIDFKEQKDPVYLEYEYKFIDPLRSKFNGSSQRSWIRLQNVEVPVQFEKSGYVLNPLSFAQYGYWSFERMADRVPIDFYLSLK